MAQSQKQPMALYGLLVVDKPLGWSSMEAVRRVRRAAGGVKTGHAGTLDPLATGVVICCLGKATRLVEQLMELTKIYQGVVDLSAFTRTDDLEGERTEITVQHPPSLAAIEQALAGMTGWIDQKPPAFSAVHVKGKRAYELARSGQTVALGARRIRIDQIQILDYTWPRLALKVVCGRGTYIRSIARDLGVNLGTGGHLANLRRTAVGPLDLSRAVDHLRLQSPLGQTDLIDPASIGLK